MKASAHVYASAAAGGAACWLTGSAAAGAACLLGGVLLDLDHLPDFLLDSEEPFTVKNFLSWCYDLKWKKVYLLLHSYELYALLALSGFFFRSPAFYGFLLGMGLHLLMDQAGNRFLNKWFYFFVFRYRSGFAFDALTRAGREGAAQAERP